MKRIKKENKTIRLAMTICFVLILLIGYGRAGTSSPNKVPTVSAIRPATVVDDQPPSAWSHLIVKSHTRVGAGDTRKVPSRDLRMASRFSMVMLANVYRTNSNQYELQNIGVGCAAKIKGQDTVVSPDTHKKLGADLGFFEGFLLKEMCKRQAKVGLVGYQPTTGIIDVPAAVRWRGQNQMMIVRYALLVDSKTGQLDSFVWLVDPDKAVTKSVVSNIQWLATNCVDHCVLHVDSRQYRFGTIPSDTAYAALSIPRGQQQLRVTESTQQLLGSKRFSAADVAKVEQVLRSLQKERLARASQQQR